MKKIALLMLSLLLIACINMEANTKPETTIFAFGGDVNQKFAEYVVKLTGKPKPKVCYVPTASADNENNIEFWNSICEKLSIEPHVLKVWIDSKHTTQTFEDMLLGMDAIVIGGGNTLNMMAIWKAQGIDEILEKALNKGIVLAGGSAGSICWFQNGVSDSRPMQLSVVDGLSILPYSHCAHYGDAPKKEMYHQLIGDNTMQAGYACDDLSGVLFKNGKYVESVSQNDSHHSYYVSKKGGVVHAEKLPSEILLSRDALPATAYKVISVGQKVGDYPEKFSQDTPLEAFVSLKHLLANGKRSKLKELSSRLLQSKMNDMPDIELDEKAKNEFMNIPITQIFILDDAIACVVNKAYDDFYGMWYFYKEDGKWMSAGEDIGGETELGSEPIFRERAAMHLKKSMQPID